MVISARRKLVKTAVSGPLFDCMSWRASTCVAVRLMPESEKTQSDSGIALNGLFTRHMQGFF